MSRGPLFLPFFFSSKCHLKSHFCRNHCSSSKNCEKSEIKQIISPPPSLAVMKFHAIEAVTEFLIYQKYHLDSGDLTPFDIYSLDNPTKWRTFEANDLQCKKKLEEEQGKLNKLNKPPPPRYSPSGKNMKSRRWEEMIVF